MRRDELWAAVAGILACGCSPAGDERPPAALGNALASGAIVATQTAKLAPITANAVDQFGAAIAIDGYTILAGLPRYSGAQIADHGLAFVFEGSPNGWQQTDVLAVPFPLPGALFGSVVAINGSQAAIAAPGDGPNGSVYVFSHSAAGWSGGVTLRPPDTEKMRFGTSLALDVDRVVIGSPVPEDFPGVGTAYVYALNGNVWVEDARLFSTSIDSRLFGQAVAIEGTSIAVGEPVAALPSLEPAGSVYVFQRFGSNWVSMAVVSGPASFGTAVALSGGKLYVGAPAVVEEGIDSGVVYEFEWVAGALVEIAKITPQVPQPGMAFGESLALDGSWLAVGSSSASERRGSTHLFLNAGEWASQTTVIAEDGAAEDRFGSAVALSRNNLIVGAFDHDGFGVNAGAVYVYSLGLEPGSECTTSDECAGYCVNGMCCNEPCSGGCEACRELDGASTNGKCGPVQAGTDTGRCHPLVCNGARECPQGCLELGCGTFYYCDPDSAACLPRKARGASCATNEACASDNCSAGTCCDGPCDGCQACKSSLTLGENGVCAPVIAGTDPNGACFIDADFPESCGADGLCDGAGNCRAHAPPTTPCGPTSCEGDSIVGLLCNGSGACADSRASCSPLECRGGLCGRPCQSDHECSDSGFCTSFGVCGPKQPLGQACDRSVECISAHCADGRCCDTPCSGQCESCAGIDGTCRAVSGEAPAGRAPCGGATPGEPCRARRCDGVERDQCAAFVADVVCRAARCSGGKAEPEAQCDGSGSCATGTPIDCGSYACENGRCKTSCAAREDCAQGSTCAEPAGTCVLVATCDGHHLLKTSDGREIDCAPYRCLTDGTCPSSCTSALQCMDGNVCSSDGVCVPRDFDGSSCACRVTRAPATPLEPEARGGLLVLLALFGRASRQKLTSQSGPLGIRSAARE